MSRRFLNLVMFFIYIFCILERKIDSLFSVLLIAMFPVMIGYAILGLYYLLVEMFDVSFKRKKRKK